MIGGTQSIWSKIQNELGWKPQHDFENRTYQGRLIGTKHTNPGGKTVETRSGLMKILGTGLSGLVGRG